LGAKDRHALVTGGGGFIGSHLVDQLVGAGWAVRVLDNFATGRRSNLLHIQDEIELVEGDIQSYERVHNAVRGRDVVFHLAALPSVPRSLQDPLTSNASNITGVLNVLLASRDAGVRRVVYASSSSIYGANPELPKRETALPTPISPYAVAKLAGEGYCQSFATVYGLETVALRFFNVFGPRQDPRSQYAAVIPNFISALSAAQPPTIFGDGEQSRDFTYIDNVIAANLLAAEADGVAGRIYNIACGERVSINQLFAELRSVLDSQIDAIHDSPRAGEVKHSCADISRAKEELGYRPLVGLEEGLTRTVDHFRAMAAEPVTTPLG
jgi:UDP-glucose 4-epimerase